MSLRSGMPGIPAPARPPAWRARCRAYRVASGSAVAPWATTLCTTVICTTNAINPLMPGCGGRWMPAVIARPGRRPWSACTWRSWAEPGPDREGPWAADQPVEGRPERRRHHRRPPERGRK